MEVTLKGIVEDMTIELGNAEIIVEGNLYEVKIGPIWYLNIEVGDTVKIGGRLVTTDEKNLSLMKV